MCETIGEVRDERNAGLLTEAGENQAAIKEMKRKGLHAYRHAGIELALVEGVDKLRVRKSKSAENTASTEAPPDVDEENEDLAAADTSAEIH